MSTFMNNYNAHTQVTVIKLKKIVTNKKKINNARQPPPPQKHPLTPSTSQILPSSQEVITILLG